VTCLADEGQLLDVLNDQPTEEYRDQRHLIKLKESKLVMVVVKELGISLGCCLNT